MKLLIGTISGLLLWSDGVVSELLPGRVYGISKLKNRWYCFRSFEEKNEILELNIVSDKLVSYRTIIMSSFGVHQIDFYNERLIVSDTRNNRILIYPNLLEIPITVVPNKIQNAQLTETHLHLNSVYCVNGALYAIAHNLSTKYNRPSELYEISLNNYEIIKHSIIDGRDCHNVYVDNNKLMFLDSFNGRVVYDGKQVFKKEDCFLRGLSVTEDYYVVGSTLRASREQRNVSSILILDKSFKCIFEHKLDVAIFEIRCLDQPDFSLSDTSRTKFNENLSLETI